MDDAARGEVFLLRSPQGAGENATVTMGKLATRIIEELTVHTYLENEVMYPEVRRLIPELEKRRRNRPSCWCPGSA